MAVSAGPLLSGCSCPCGQLRIKGICTTYPWSFLFFALVSSACGSENTNLVETVADSFLGPSSMSSGPGTHHSRVPRTILEAVCCHEVVYTPPQRRQSISSVRGLERRCSGVRERASRHKPQVLAYRSSRGWGPTSRCQQIPSSGSLLPGS